MVAHQDSFGIERGRKINVITMLRKVPGEKEHLTAQSTLYTLNTNDS